MVALVLVGSHARDAARVDSDIDFVLISSQPASLLNDHSWQHTFGEPCNMLHEDWGLVQSIRVFYSDLEVEFGIAGLEWVQPPIDPGTAEVIAQPLRVLFDPDSLIAIAKADVCRGSKLT